MEDDIDIEDHDVLDNPVIKKMFPDLSVLKKEIAIYEEKDIAIKSEPDVVTWTPPITPADSLNPEQIIIRDDCSLHTGILSISEENVSIKNEAEPIFTNKIILGTKPNQLSKTSEEHYEKNVKPYMSRISLKDIGSFLLNSGKFCRTCKILFPKKEDLKKHLTINHKIQGSPNSLLHKVPSKKCKCEKCRAYFIKSNNLLGYINKMRCRASRKQTENSKMKLRYFKNVSRSFSLHSSQTNGYRKVGDSKCFHCKKKFGNQQLLIEHIYNVLQSSNKMRNLRLNKRKSIPMVKLVTQKCFLQNKSENPLHSLKSNKNSVHNNMFLNSPNKSENNNKTKEKVQFYRCYYCSYYFKNKKQYTNHLKNKHKETNILNNKLYTFNPECRYCFSVMRNFYSYNVHLQKNHKDIIDNTIKIIPVLCIPKVEYALAIKKVTETNYNMEILHDNVSDMQSSEKSEQNIKGTADIENTHNTIETNGSLNNITLSPKDTTLENLSNKIENIPLVLQKVLFKCQRCDIYFMSAKSAMNHSDHMELLINWKCSNCQRIFKKCDEKYHILQHNYTNEFTVYELNEQQLSRVLYKCSKCAVNFSDVNYSYHYKICEDAPECVYCIKCDFLIDKRLKQCHDTEHKSDKILVDYTIVDSDPIILDGTKNKMVKSDSRQYKENNKMGYCESCKGFVDRSFFTCHKQEYCKKMRKRVCKYCGLFVTMESFKLHLRKHKDQKRLTLQNVVFYDLKTGKQILPPLPNYPKCTECKVHYLSKLTLSKHTCEVNDFLTCPVCDMKLSDLAFKLHIGFHHYKKSGEHKLNRSIIMHNEAVQILPSNSLRTIPSTAILESKGLDLTINDANFSKVFPNKHNICDQNESSKTESVKKNCQNKDEISPKSEKKSFYMKVTPSDLELYSVVYCCSNCYITLDTYDTAVEHCQEHFNDINFSVYRDTCTVCKMKYDRRFYGDHKILHNLQLEKKIFSLLTFDPFYFAHDYNIWVKTTFDSIDLNIVKSILDRSIYKYEGRIKLHTIQVGSCNKTVYRCNSCHVYIEPETIYKHGENSCFRTRKHPCSYCGLPFISHVSRINHEEVHKKSSDMSSKVFRIVIFNREKDKQFNKNIINSNEKFVLFMCRKCHGIFDRFQDRYHMCNTLDLKKCSTCSLHVFSSDYKTHIAKHKYMKSFIHANMRIICFGQRNKHKPSTGLPEKFHGTLIDYIFYVCSHCNICFKKSNQTLMINHDCSDTKSKVKCDKCQLFFLKRQINNHNKQHEIDQFFVAENFSLIPYKETDFEVDTLNCSSEFRDQSTTSEIGKGMLNDDNISNKTNDESSDKISSDKNNVEEMNDESRSQASFLSESNYTDSGTIGIITEHVNKIYKCSCGLHFLNSEGIKSHFGHCTLKITKQNCSKCGLLFTPKELFNHLLKHHGDKKNKYKMNIINMAKDKSNIFHMYKCSICAVHFVELEKAKIHFVNCENADVEKLECVKCKLFIDVSSFDEHKATHHEDDVADIDIVDIGKIDIFGKYKSMDVAIKNLAAEADAVIATDYNISQANLALIDLKKYNNTIYKCEKCKIHFLTESTFRTHTVGRAGHEPFTSPYSDCNFCGLRFSLPSLCKHIYIHHEQMKLDLNNFIIRCKIECS